MANRININMASSKELEQLPRIGQVAAGRIIANRPYNKIEDLSQVQGISAKTVEEISHLISLNEETEDDVIALLPTGGADNLEGEMEEIEVDAGDETVNELAEELIPVERTEMVELEDEDAPVDEPLLPEDAPGEGGETELEDEAAPVDEPLPPEDAPDEDEETTPLPPVSSPPLPERPEGNEEEIRLGDILSLSRTRPDRLCCRGREIPLTSKEFDLLWVLAEQAGKCVSYERLLDRVWPDAAVEQQQISSHKSKILKKINRACGKSTPAFIRTIRGRGLILEAPEE